MNTPSFTTMEEKLTFILKQFKIEGELLKWRRISAGHINAAYYTAVYDGMEIQQYLVQQVNCHLFREPEAMMRNIDRITRYIMEKQPAAEHRRRLHFHHTKEIGPYGPKNYFEMGEGEKREFWRVTNYCDRSVSFESFDGSEEVLRNSGKAFGHFDILLQDFDASLLTESIPHFHDTRYRLDTFFTDAEKDICGRAKEVQPEIEEIRTNWTFACTLCDAIERGELPIRVAHNDTKTNNVLFDRDTLEPLVVIDLDTCMPGLWCYDFGDIIRFAACTAAEDDETSNQLDLKLFRACADGYLSETAGILTENEVKSLSLGACIMTLELAVRFLDDYLTGDTYFRIDSPDQNLRRARSQLSLFRSMMINRQNMDEIIREEYAKHKA